MRRFKLLTCLTLTVALVSCSGDSLNDLSTRNMSDMNKRLEANQDELGGIQIHTPMDKNPGYEEDCALCWVVPIIGLVKTIVEHTNGSYHKHIHYHEGADGSIDYTVDVSCDGTWGTCSANGKATSDKKTNGSAANENISLNPPIISSQDALTHMAHMILANTVDYGVLFGINSTEFSTESNEFFTNGDIKIINGTIMVDNPKILDELKLDHPITIQGEYAVHTMDGFKYIVIDN